MPLKLETLVAVAAISLINEVVRHRPLQKRFDEVAFGIAVLYDENETLKEKAKYLLHVLEENDVALDEFDLIALTHDIPKQEED
jgi:hypothetical protein